MSDVANPPILQSPPRRRWRIWAVLGFLVTAVFAYTLWPNRFRFSVKLGDVHPAYDGYSVSVTFTNDFNTTQQLYYENSCIETDTGHETPFNLSIPLDRHMKPRETYSETFVLVPCPDYAVTAKKIRLRYDLTEPYKGPSLYNRFFGIVFLLSDNRPNWSVRNDEPKKKSIWTQWIDTSSIPRRNPTSTTETNHSR